MYRLRHFLDQHRADLLGGFQDLLLNRLLLLEAHASDIAVGADHLARGADRRDVLIVVASRIALTSVLRRRAVLTLIMVEVKLLRVVGAAYRGRLPAVVSASVAAIVITVECNGIVTIAIAWPVAASGLIFVLLIIVVIASSPAMAGARRLVEIASTTRGILEIEVKVKLVARLLHAALPLLVFSLVAAVA